MNRASIQITILIVFFLLGFQGLSSQNKTYPAKLPLLNYSKIKKAKITTDFSSFSAYVCDIDSSSIYYYLDKRKTKELMKAKCKGCLKYPVEKVQHISYIKLSTWGHATNFLAGIGTAMGLVSLASSNPNDDYAYAVAIVIGIPSALINIGNLATSNSRRGPRTLTKEELQNHSFEDSWELIAYKSYQKFLFDQKNFCHLYNNYIYRHPNKSKKSYFFRLVDGEGIIGYIVKVENDKIHLTKDKKTLTELRKTQSDTDLNFDISKIEKIEKFNAAYL